MLPCLHSFCLLCLNKVSEINGAKKTLQCPTCKEIAPLQENGVQAFPKDLRKACEAEVANYMAKLSRNKEECDRCVRKNFGPAIAFCINCHEFLCKACKEDHLLWRKTLNHEIISTGEKKETNEGNLFSKCVKQPSQCPQQDHEILKYYCGKCNVVMCHDCIELDHSDHRSECNLLESVAAIAMKSLKLEQVRSQKAITELGAAIAQCKKASQQVQQKKKEVDKKITKSLARVRDTLLAKNEEICLQKVTSLEMQVSELQKLQDGLNHASGMIATAQSHTAAQQLSTKKLLSNRAALLLEKVSTTSLIPMETDTFITKIADPATISQMVSLGDIESGSHAASSLCDVEYIPRAIVGKKRTIKVTARNEDGKRFPIGGETVEAKLSLLGSKDPVISGKATDHGDGTYLLSFIPESSGEHELHVTIAGRHVKNSPFILKVRQPRITPFSSLSCRKKIYTQPSHVCYACAPWDVALTDGGSLVVGEHSNNTVSVYSMDGTYQFNFGISHGMSCIGGENQFSKPKGIAIQGDVLYVSDSGNHRIQKFSISKQSFISKFGTQGSGDGQLSNPHGICTDPEGKVYVADYGNIRIQVFQADGTFAYSITADPRNKDSAFIHPWGLAFDPQGFLHITAYTSHCIKMYTPNGQYVSTYGSGTIQNPAGIAIDEEGYVAVTGHSSQEMVGNGFEEGDQYKANIGAQQVGVYGAHVPQFAGCTMAPNIGVFGAPQQHLAHGYRASPSLCIYNPDHTQLINVISDRSKPVGVAFDVEGMIWVADSSNACILQY